jgi:uncharacterized damage-inducible protein DinB
MSDLDALRFPTGRFKRLPSITSAQRDELIERIATCPANLAAAVEGLTEGQFATPYREGGWTVSQLVHHIFDSHVNAFIRFRLALTEDNPRITAYDENAWAHLHDSLSVPAQISLDLVTGLHNRWVSMLGAMTDEDFKRTLEHPENGPMTLDTMLQLYAWHGVHHVAHITSLRERNGW